MTLLKVIKVSLTLVVAVAEAVIATLAVWAVIESIVEGQLVRLGVPLTRRHC